MRPIVGRIGFAAIGWRGCGVRGVGNGRTGTPIDAASVTGLNGPAFIAVVETVPEPGSLSLLAAGLLGLAALRRRAGRAA